MHAIHNSLFLSLSLSLLSYSCSDANEKGSSSSGGGGKSGNIGVACVPALNSASACLELASQPSSVAAIAPREAAALYHLRVIESGIANDSNVETRLV